MNLKELSMPNDIKWIPPDNTCIKIVELFLQKYELMKPEHREIVAKVIEFASCPLLMVDTTKQ